MAHYVLQSFLHYFSPDLHRERRDFLLKVQTEFGRIKRTTHLSMQAARKNNEQEQ